LVPKLAILNDLQRRNERRSALSHRNRRLPGPTTLKFDCMHAVHKKNVGQKVSFSNISCGNTCKKTDNMYTRHHLVEGDNWSILCDSKTARYIAYKLVLFTNKKSDTVFRLVAKLVTLNVLERLNDRRRALSLRSMSFFVQV